MSANVEFPALSFSCPKLWAQMHGDEKTRFCDVCQKNVHNLSMMNQGERRALLASTGESPCVAYFKYLDGTPIDVTALPDGSPLKQKLARAALMSLSAVGLGAIALNSRALIEACSKDDEAPTTDMGHYSYVGGMVCSPAGSRPPSGLTPPVFTSDRWGAWRAAAVSTWPMN